MVSWTVVYARVESDKYDLGTMGVFKTREEAENYAKTLEKQKYYWAGVIEEFWKKKLEEVI
jgi:hypothetical protein